MSQTALVDDGLEDFERFWAAYPKRPNNPKRPALLEFVRLRKAGKLPDIDALLLATSRYKAQLVKDKTEPPFIAHTRTWLHQWRWEGFVEKPPASVVIGNDVLTVPLGCSPERSRKPSRIYGKHAWVQWLSDSTWLDKGERLEIIVRNRFTRDRIEGHYLSNLELLTNKLVDIKLPVSAR